MTAFVSDRSDWTLHPPHNTGLHFQDLRVSYEHHRLATSFNKEKKYWFTCGLLYVRDTQKVGMCFSLKSLNFPEPCENPVKKTDGAYECEVRRVTLVTDKPFCCHLWIRAEDKCASCTAAESNGDQRSWCNQSAGNCATCQGRQFCNSSKPKVNSDAGTLYKNRCCWGTSPSISCRQANTCTAPDHWCSLSQSRCEKLCERGSFCSENAVPKNVKTNVRMLASSASHSASMAGENIAINDAPVSPKHLILSTPTSEDGIETKSSVYFQADKSTTTVSADSFFMRIIPVMPTGDPDVCRKQALADGGCQPLCWYVSPSVSPSSRRQRQ